jgi:hypothetical protein
MALYEFLENVFEKVKILLPRQLPKARYFFVRDCFSLKHQIKQMCRMTVVKSKGLHGFESLSKTQIKKIFAFKFNEWI